WWPPRLPPWPRRGGSDRLGRRRGGSRAGGDVVPRDPAGAADAACRSLRWSSSRGHRGRQAGHRRHERRGLLVAGGPRPDVLLGGYRLGHDLRLDDYSHVGRIDLERPPAQFTSPLEFLVVGRAETDVEVFVLGPGDGHGYVLLPPAHGDPRDVLPEPRFDRDIGDHPAHRL